MFNQEESNLLRQTLIDMGIVVKEDIEYLVEFLGRYSQPVMNRLMNEDSGIYQVINQLEGVQSELNRGIRSDGQPTEGPFEEVRRFAEDCMNMFEYSCETDNEDEQDFDDEDFDNEEF